MAAVVSRVDVANILPRPTKGFPPTLFADKFISFTLDNQVQEKYAKCIEEMKEQVRSMVMNKDTKPKDKMIVIDNVERLGVSYHFKQEIEDQIEHIFKIKLEEGEQDLFTTALHFRLLRQHGYNVPCGVFEQFKDKESNAFKKTMNSDIEGLLSLYEASFLQYHGEDILEEAKVFTRHCLNQAKSELNSYLQAKVTRALKQPLHRGAQRVEARYYISIYEKDELRNDLLLKFAKLDFNFVQNLYKKELSDLLKRWKGLETIKKLSYMRERVVESYFWAVEFHSDPGSTLSRLACVDTTVMITIMNDTYDYCTLEEQQVFTEALQRCDTKEVDPALPNYLKIACKPFYSLYEEYDHKYLSKQGRSYAASYARDFMKELGMSYHQKALWYKGVETPTFQQHHSIAGINSTIYVGLSAFYMGTESASEEAFRWLTTRPKMVDASGFIGRYLNDIGSYQREHESGQYPNAVDCYMIENGVSKEEAFDKLAGFVEEAWMVLNEEWVVNLTNKTVPRYVMEPVLGYARATEVTYKLRTDGYSDLGRSPFELDVISLFDEPVII